MRLKLIPMVCVPMNLIVSDKEIIKVPFDIFDITGKKTGEKGNAYQLKVEFTNGETYLSPVFGHEFRYGDEVRDHVNSEILKILNCCVEEKADSGDLFLFDDYIGIHTPNHRWEGYSNVSPGQGASGTSGPSGSDFWRNSVTPSPYKETFTMEELEEKRKELINLLENNGHEITPDDVVVHIVAIDKKGNY